MIWQDYAVFQAHFPWFLRLRVLEASIEMTLEVVLLHRDSCCIYCCCCRCFLVVLSVNYVQIPIMTAIGCYFYFGKKRRRMAETSHACPQYHEKGGGPQLHSGENSDVAKDMSVVGY